MWPKYWSYSISPSNEYSGLIFFKIDWFEPLAVQETLKSLLQHHNLKASILWCSAFFMAKVKSMTCDQFSSVSQSSPALCDPSTEAHQASLSITNYQSLLKLMSIESVMPSNHLILCRPLFLLPSIFSSIRVFSNESVLHIRWPKYWSFSFSISPSNEYSGLISFRIYWLDLLAIQGKESSPTPQFKSINSLVFSFLYGPTLIFIHDYWKSHSFD